VTEMILATYRHTHFNYLSPLERNDLQGHKYYRCSQIHTLKHTHTHTHTHTHLHPMLLLLLFYKLAWSISCKGD